MWTERRLNRSQPHQHTPSTAEDDPVAAMQSTSALAAPPVVTSPLFSGHPALLSQPTLPLEALSMQPATLLLALSLQPVHYQGKEHKHSAR